MNQTGKNRLSQRELNGYRQWLAELEEEMSDTPGLSQRLDGDLTLYFSPECPIGRQVYTSFSDEELLEPLVETMEGRNGLPRPERLLCVYRWYLEKRFGSLHHACWRARGRSRQKAAEGMWPADWPERVDMEPFLERCASRGLILDGDDRAGLGTYCAMVRRTGQPPSRTDLPEEVSRLFERAGCTWQTGLELLGIPALSKSVRRHMRRYWAGAAEKNQA